MNEEIIRRLRGVDTVRGTLRRGDFTASAYSGGGNETVVLETKADQPFALRNGVEYRLVPVARETFTTDGTGGNTETFSLSHDIIDSDQAEDLVLHEDGTGYVEEDAISYSNDTFDYTDDGTNNTLTAYYVTATQASWEIQKVGPGGSPDETLVQHDGGLVARRDPNRDPLEFDLRASPLQAVVPTNFRLQITVDGPYPAGWDPSTDPDPINFLVSIPIARARASSVEGLESAVRRDSAERV
ncbi:MAG: hypothetical protein ABEH78_07940 [Haloferacaceae archaeon]